MNKMYGTLDLSFEDAYHDCKLIADSIVDEESFQKADTGVILYCMDRILEALERQVPKKVIIPRWAPATCPTCGCELSENVGDGYYRHPTYLGRCPKYECAQKLDWGEEDD